jgi:hypothetical protein
MREGPLAELFKATEAAQRQAERERAAQEGPDAPTVEHAAPTPERDEPTAAAPPARDTERPAAPESATARRVPSRRRIWPSSASSAWAEEG